MRATDVTVPQEAVAIGKAKGIALDRIPPLAAVHVEVLIGAETRA